MGRALSLIGFLCLLLCVLAGCGQQETPMPETQAETTAVQSPEDADSQNEEVISPQEREAQDTELPPGAGLPDSEFEDTPENQPEPARLVVIDPGHQAQANTGTEPLGPGSSEMKMKVSGGTQGVVSGVPEYELNLTISLLLREELEARGYQVLLTRETNDVDLSNRERAEIANSAGADLFLRIHADGSENPSTNGAMTLCPTPQSPFPIGGLYPQCRLLADCVLDELVAATGAYQERVWETDTMSGLNWCQVPVTLVEMGYMTNQEEDARLNDPAYQTLIVQGIANGVDKYFTQVEE